MTATKSKTATIADVAEFSVEEKLKALFDFKKWIVKSTRSEPCVANFP